MTAAAVERHDIQAFEIRKEIEIDATIEISFQSVLDELGPEGQMPNGQSLAMKIEPWPGGRWYRDLGNNTGHLWGHVQVIKPPTLLEITGPMPMSYPAVNHVQYHRDGMPQGWQHWLERIRDLAQRRNRKESGK